MARSAGYAVGKALRMVLEAAMVVMVLVSLTLLWNWEDMKYDALYTCEDQEKKLFGFGEEFEAPEWCEAIK